MLTVVTIIGVLAASSMIALNKGRELARRTRAETEMREVLAAWLQFHQTYGEWPDVARGKIHAPATAALLDPLLNTDNPDNERGLVFLNVQLPADDLNYRDPWGSIYQFSFDRDTEGDPDVTVLRTSVTFPNRHRRTP